MALTNWNDILNKPNGIDEVPEIALTVEQLSASVLSMSEDVGEIAGDVQEIALEVSQLSASTLPYSNEETIKEKIDEVTSGTLTPGTANVTLHWGYWSKVKNVVTAVASVTVSETAGPNYLIVQGLPTSSENNCNTVTIEPEYDDSGEALNKVARIYGNGIFVNSNNALTANKKYYIKAVYPA